MHTKHPDGFAIQEIREQLLNKTVDIHSLDMETIRELYDYELAWAELDKSDSPTILMELLDVLQQAGEPNDAFDIVSSERCMELAADALAQNERAQLKKRPRKLKKIILIAAAILVLSSIGAIITTSESGTFAKFFDNIADIFNVKPGDVLVSDNEELMADNTTRFYDSFDALMQEEGITVLYPQELALQSGLSLRTHYAGETKRLIANYESATMSIEFINPMYTEDDFVTRTQNLISREINGHVFYDLIEQGSLQLVMFHNGYLYTITAKNHADLLAFAQLIE